MVDNLPLLKFVEEYWQNKDLNLNNEKTWITVSFINVREVKCWIENARIVFMKMQTSNIMFDQYSCIEYMVEL